MTIPQQKKLDEILEDEIFLFEELEFHHGDCIGADDQAGNLAIELGYTIVTHPPTNESKRAFADYDIELPRKPYLERNHDIVNQTDHLIAAPKEMDEQVRSGTWATIRYAEKKMKDLTIIFPDGSVNTRRII
jgi:hypothetical protein